MRYHTTGKITTTISAGIGRAIEAVCLP